MVEMMSQLVAISALVGAALATAPGEPIDHDLAPSVYNEHMDVLEKEALDQSFRKHMANLFDVWMREPETDPGRTIAGADKLRHMYDKVMTEIDRRIAERKAKTDVDRP